MYIVKIKSNLYIDAHPYALIVDLTADSTLIKEMWQILRVIYVCTCEK